MQFAFEGDMAQHFKDFPKWNASDQLLRVRCNMQLRAICLSILKIFHSGYHHLHSSCSKVNPYLYHNVNICSLTFVT